MVVLHGSRVFVPSFIPLFLYYYYYYYYNLVRYIPRRIVKHLYLVPSEQKDSVDSTGNEIDRYSEKFDVGVEGRNVENAGGTNRHFTSLLVD